MPLQNHKELTKSYEEASNRDGFYYPPRVSRYEIDLPTFQTGKKIERSERPAQIFPLPPSHQIYVSDPIDKENEFSSDDSLIINLLGYIYGTRLQFSDWEVDRRVPVNSKNDIVVSDRDCLHFLEHVYSWWRTREPEARTRFINILYVLARTRGLEWTWEKFAFQYMVFDAIWKLHRLITPQKKAGHEDRFKILFKKYGIANNEQLVKRIYPHRNNLFHEAMWAGSPFGFATKDKEASILPLHLDALNSRLICSLTGYDNEYSSSIWWSGSMHDFSKPD